jgi:hypothetical protein
MRLGIAGILILSQTNAIHTLALTSPTSGGRSVGIVRSRTQATESCPENINVLVPKIAPLHMGP